VSLFFWFNIKNMGGAMRLSKRSHVSIHYLFGCFLAAGLVSAPVYAGLSVSSAVYSGLNQFDDNDTEDIDYDANGNGLLEVGDTLSGWLDINEIFQLDAASGLKTGLSTSLGSGTLYNELTGIFEIEVISRTLLLAGTDTVFGTADDVYQYTFGAHAGFADGLDGVSGTADDLPTGSMYALYEDASQNFNLSDVTTAYDGSLVMVFGFDGLDTDEQQTALAPQDPDAIATGSSAGSFNIQASLLFNGLSVSFGENMVTAGCVPFDLVNPCDVDVTDDSLVDVNASGSLEGGVLVGGVAQVSSDVQFVLYRVPEPSSIALFGLGLLLVGGFFRRGRHFTNEVPSLKEA